MQGIGARLGLLAAAAGLATVVAAQEGAPRRDAPAVPYKDTLPIDHPAVGYAAAAPGDRVGRLARDLGLDPTLLGPSRDLGALLPALLKRLDVPADSQMLVFSKTSFQARHISPDRPRAIYFADDVAVAWVPGADDIEIAGLDPAHGPRFYTLTVGASGRPAIAPGDTCLHCHHGPNTDGVAGLYVGSVVPGPSGAPLRDQTAIVTDHRTPFAERYGGWYVNARRGEPLSRANAVAANPVDPETLVREVPQNLATLMGVVSTAAYPAPASDLVALLVYEHQTRMTNLLTRVAWEARIATAGGPPVPAASLDEDVEDVVRYLLFSGEPPLRGPVEGASGFAAAFGARAARDARGRSLRDFDLRTRIFRHPLSYTIYGAQFAALPLPIRERIHRRLDDVLSGRDASPPFAHLAAADRRAIREILAGTRGVLPAPWGDAR
jgi:hypothetical protein